MTSDMKLPDTSSIIVVVVLMIVLVASFVMTVFYGVQAKEYTPLVLICDSEKKVYSLRLDEDALLSIETKEGFNTIVVSSGSVRILDSDCPDHDCVTRGGIANPGQRIVCRSHHLVVEISVG